MNMAPLAKLGWQVLSCPEEIWCKVFRSKYRVRDEDGAHFKDKQRSSHVWKGVVWGVELLRLGLRWEVCNRRLVKFWKDNWLDSKPLQDHLLNPIDEGTSKLKVIDCWDNILLGTRSRLEMGAVKPLNTSNKVVAASWNSHQCQCWGGIGKVGWKP